MHPKAVLRGGAFAWPVEAWVREIVGASVWFGFLVVYWMLRFSAKKKECWNQRNQGFPPHL